LLPTTGGFEYHLILAEGRLNTVFFFPPVIITIVLVKDIDYSNTVKMTFSNNKVVKDGSFSNFEVCSIGLLH